MSTLALTKKLPRTFDGLVELMVPHAIKNDADYDAVTEIADCLAVLDHRTPGQEKYFETLCQLIGAYDDEHFQMDLLGFTGLKALKRLMEMHQLTSSDLGRLLGNRALGSKILRGERELSKTHIKLLSDRFKVSPALFL